MPRILFLYYFFTSECHMPSFIWSIMSLQSTVCINKLYMQVLYALRGWLMELWHVPTLTTSFNRSFSYDAVPLFSSLSVPIITKMGCAKNVTIVSPCELLMLATKSDQKSNCWHSCLWMIKRIKKSFYFLFSWFNECIWRLTSASLACFIFETELWENIEEKIFWGVFFFCTTFF